MGLLAALLGAFFAASKDLVSKRLASRLDGTASTFSSYAFAIPYYVVALAILCLLGREKLTFTLTFLTVAFLRSFVDTLAEGMKMYAFALGDISLVATFFSLSPLLLLIAMPLITGDPLSVPGVIAVVLITGGSLLLVYRPSSKSWVAQKKGIFLALGACVFFTLNSCFDRLAVKEGEPFFTGFSMTMLSALFVMPLVMFRRDRWQAMHGEQPGLWIRGLLEISFMVSKLYASQYLTPTDVVVVLRLSLLWSIIGGRVFFKEEDFGRRLAAGICIVGGVLLIAWLQVRTP